MSVAFRSSTLGGGTNGTGFTATEPTGAAQNDILFMWVVVANNAGWTPPTGWTLLYSFTGTGVFGYLYWIRRGSSAPSLSASWTNSVYYEVSVTAWSGCATSGNPYSTSAKNTETTKNPNNPDCPAVNTGVANTIVAAFGMGWSGWGATAWGMPTGYSIADDGSGISHADLCIGYKAVATAGTEDPGAFSNGLSQNDWCFEATVALQPPQTGIALEAAVSCSANVTAALTTSITLASAAGCALTASAALTTGVTMAASATGSATVSAVLTTQIRLAASVSAVTAATAILTTGITLAVNATAQASSSAALTTSITLSAAVAAVTTTWADLTVSSIILLSASPSCSASVSAGLTTAIRLNGAASGSAEAAGSITTTILLAATAGCTISALGELLHTIAAKALLASLGPMRQPRLDAGPHLQPEARAGSMRQPRLGVGILRQPEAKIESMRQPAADIGPMN